MIMSANSAKQGNYRNFMLTTYFVAHGTAHTTREQLEKDLSFFEKHMRLDKIYLEPFRAEQASHEQVEMCKQVFQAHGIQVEGGLTTVIRTPEGAEPKARLFDTFCYNDPAMRARLKEVSRFLGEHYDAFIIDDFFFTDCACETCIRERDQFNASHGIEDGSWQAYRLDLLRRVSEEDIIGPARAANPEIKITIKYPNWAESYQETGYNPADQRRLFDRIYTGTETRDPVAQDQHLPRYLSYSLMTYFENMWPGHNGGGWFDNFDLHITEHYLEQAYLTAFSKPKELMLFCFQSLTDHPLAASLGWHLDHLDDVLDYAGNPVGIPCYLPDNCQGEDNLQDFLGMCGLPVVCTPYFPEDATQMILTRSSACDPEIVEKLDRYLREKGGDVLVTSGFIAATEDRGIHRITSIRLRGRQVIADRWRVESVDSPSCVFPYGDHPIAMPVVEFRNNATWAVVKGEHGEESFAVLLRDSYGKGRMWTLTAPGAFPDFYAFPEAAWNRIRQAFPVAGLWLEGAPRVSLFPYDNDAFILYPYVMEKNQFTRVRMHVRGAAALENPLARHAARKRIDPLYIQNGEAVFDLPARPGDYTIYRILR